MGKNWKSTKHRKTRGFLAGKGVGGWGGGPSLLRRGEKRLRLCHGQGAPGRIKGCRPCRRPRKKKPGGCDATFFGFFRFFLCRLDSAAGDEILLLGNFILQLEMICCCYLLSTSLKHNALIGLLEPLRLQYGQVQMKRLQSLLRPALISQHGYPGD